jgi:serralysin
MTESGEDMATLTLMQGFEDVWPPDAMAGGTITLRQAKGMTYTSDAGFTVLIRGKDLTYDDDGLPAGGTVTGFSISKNAVVLANMTLTSTDFGAAGMWLFGYDRGNGDFRGPDPYSFVQLAMRGNDLVTGSSDEDDIRGGSGNDRIDARGGNDYVADWAGADSMDGGDGWDTLSYDEAIYSSDAFRGINLDALAGTVIDAWGYADTIANFERYKDTVFGDTMRGANVDERFVLSRGNDSVDGRDGFDFVSYDRANNWGAKRGVTVNLATGIATDSWRGTDRLSNIEGVYGSRLDDKIIGTAGYNDLSGNDGNDTIQGGGGDDQIGGDLGNDLVVGGLGNDNIDGGADNDTMTGNDGRDNFNFGWGLDEVGIDTVTDFKSGTDKLWIGSWWGGDFVAETLAANQFRSGSGVTAANSATQRLIYNTSNGDLYFDADGVDGVDAVKFATLTNLTALTFTDIFVWL